MSTFHRILASILICAVIIVLSVAGLASDFATHLFGDIDGLLLFMISLLMLGIFTMMLFVLAKETGLLPSHRGKHDLAAGSAEAPRAARAVADDEVQPNQATHPVAQRAAQPALRPSAAAAPPAKIGEGK